MNEISEWLRWFDRLLEDIPKLFKVIAWVENNFWVFLVILFLLMFLVCVIGILCGNIIDLKSEDL